jgi:hypothetical protein
MRLRGIVHCTSNIAYHIWNKMSTNRFGFGRHERVNVLSELSC